MKQLWKKIAALLLAAALTTAAGCAGSADNMEVAQPPQAAADAGAAAEEGEEQWSTAEQDDWDGDELLPESEEFVAGETYLVIEENPEKAVEEESTLTFSLKVDTASYSNVSRYLRNGDLPPADAVRTEELVNYFRYDSEPAFEGDSPFGIYTELGPSPFGAGKYMAFVRVKTQDLDKSELPSSNLTFLIDTSGSMSSHDKLPLLKEAFAMLVDTLDENDTVSIVTYAGNAGVVLDSAGGGDKDTILTAIYALEAEGSTAGEEGIQSAYALAEKNYRADRNNRVILASDGDFNVGISDIDELAEFIGDKRDSGVYLSVLGLGTGNVRDDVMETLAANGNGNYSYINSLSTARKVLVEEVAANLFVVAADVKAQVEFNPTNIASYRLIGYENRRMSNRDFSDDTKDAGEIGAGADVVALFELELAEGLDMAGLISVREQSGESYADELFEVRIRYKEPGEEESRLLTNPVSFDSAVQTNSSDFRFACGVAAFGHLLRGSRYVGDVNAGDILDMAGDALGEDQGGYRAEFLELVRLYAGLVE